MDVATDGLQKIVKLPAKTLQLTEMITLQRRTEKDKKRREILYDIQRYLSQQVYYACGASASGVSAWARHVRDFNPNIGADYGGRLEFAWIEK